MAENPVPTTETGAFITDTGAVLQLPKPTIAALQQYDRTYSDANQDVGALDKEFSLAISDYNAKQQYLLEVSAGASMLNSPEVTAATNGVRVAEQRLNSVTASRDHLLAQRQKAADERAKAYSEAVTRADPTTQAALQADVAKKQTDAAKADADLKEWQSTADDRKLEVAAKQRLAGAQAAVAEQQAAFDKETEPTRKALLGQSLAKATADVTTAQADAGVANQLAGLRVQQAGATVAHTTAQTGLVGAQAAEANATATRTTALQPGEIAQQTATTGLTNAQTAEANARANPVLSRISEIQQAFKDGKLDTLPDPQQFVTDSIAAAGAGTTPFDIFKNQQAEQTARLTQQVNQRDAESRLLGLKAGAFGQENASEFGTLADMNKAATPGSDGGAAAFMYLNQLNRQQLGGENNFQLGPQVPIPNAPSFLDQYRQPAAATLPAQSGGIEGGIPLGGGGSPAPAAPGPAPQTAAPPAGPDASQQSRLDWLMSSPASPIATPANQPPAPDQGAQPAYLANQGPAMPDHVHALYPEASARYQQRQAAGVM